MPYMIAVSLEMSDEPKIYSYFRLYTFMSIYVKNSC